MCCVHYTTFRDSTISLTLLAVRVFLQENETAQILKEVSGLRPEGTYSCCSNDTSGSKETQVVEVRHTTLSGS